MKDSRGGGIIVSPEIDIIVGKELPADLVYRCGTCGTEFCRPMTSCPKCGEMELLTEHRHYAEAV